MIKRALYLYNQIDAFCAANQRLFKQIQEENDNDRSVCCDMLTLGNLETLEKLYNLIKLFQDFTTRIESHALTGYYKVLWKLFLAIKLLIAEYKKCDSHYTV